MIYTVTLNPAIDYVMHCNALQGGTINRSVREAYFAGGEGINVATILNRLGQAATALGFVAGFTGEEICRAVKAEGILDDFIMLPDGMTRINVKLRSGTETDINAAGPAVPGKALESLLGQIKTLKAGDTLVLAGNIPATLPRDTYVRILQKVPQGVRVAVDTEGEALRSVLCCRPFLLKPNHHELGALFDMELKTPDQVQHAAHRLQQQGARNVLVSCAQDGAYLFEENGTVHHKDAVKGELVDSVGAGDSMLGGFLAGLAENDNEMEKALCYGVACGGATAFTEGLADAVSMRAQIAQAVANTKA